jgi:hypothetical protein
VRTDGKIAFKHLFFERKFNFIAYYCPSETEHLMTQSCQRESDGNFLSQTSKELDGKLFHDDVAAFDKQNHFFPVNCRCGRQEFPCKYSLMTARISYTF